MKTFYHCLIMWIPFVLLFTYAVFGLEFVEGNKIMLTEQIKLNNPEPFHLLMESVLVIVLYPISFLPLTLIVNEYVKKLIFKLFVFTFSGGLLGAFVFKIIFDSYFIEEFKLSIFSSIIIFSIAGLLYTFVELFFKRTIKFV